MEYETKISKGYQVVVPAKLRKKYCLIPGDRLLWEDRKGELRVRIRKRLTWKDIAGMVAGEKRTNAVELKKKAQRGEL